MVRARSEKAAKSEARVKDALNQIKGKDRKTAYQAAKDTGASKSTLYRRLSGGKSRAEAHEFQQLLHNYEEKALVVWITMMASTGNPVGHAVVREMAKDIRNQRLIGINDESMSLIEYPPIGQSWVKRFLKRYPFLQTALSRSIEASRIKEVSVELVSQFFDVFTQVLTELEIELQDVYNMDETGYFCGVLFANRNRFCIGNKRSSSGNYKLCYSSKL